MATSEVEICNRAIGRVGVDQLIESMDDPNDRARNCKLQYEPCRDEVLSDFPWNFAQTCVALALVSDVEVPGWRYVYRYPANCMKVHRVTGPEGQRLTGLSNWPYEVWDYDVLLPGRQPFAVMADPVNAGARIIVSDVETAYAWFTAKVTDPSQFSALFRSALAWRIAMELALSLRANTNLYNNAAQQYGWAVSQAQVHSFGEETTDRPPQSAAVMARY
jgi:hypothetical protein